MTTEARYQELVNLIPSGPFYDGQGQTLPYKDSPTSFILATGFPNQRFLIKINDIENGYVTTDINGNAIFSVQLPLGDIELRLEREFSTDKLISYLTTREHAVWLESAAEQLESIDDSIDNTLASSRLAEAKSTDIDLAHGVPLLTSNEPAAELEAYREILQLMRQSMRQFAGRLSGKYGAVAAITQVNPLVFDRAKSGPRWILGFDLAENGNLQQASRQTASPFTNINALGQFVAIVSIDSYVPPDITTFIYHSNFKRLTWSSASVNPGASSVLKSDSPALVADGQYTIPSRRRIATLDSLHLPHTTTAGEFDRLFLEVDGHGILEVWVSLGGTLSIETKINGWFRSKLYDQYRRVSVQPAGPLALFIEVSFVSPGTPLGVGTISHTGLNAFTYAAPGDAAGAAVTITPGDTATLISANARDYIVVLYAYVTPGVVVDTFTIVSRYPSVASLIAGSDQLRLSSGNLDVVEGISSVTVHPGPANVASFPLVGAFRGIFDIPKINGLLLSNVLQGATSVEVPAGTAIQFSSHHNIINTPFNALVGYGYNISPVIFFSVTVLTADTAEILIAGAALQPNDTHIVLRVTSLPFGNRNSGAHKILSIDFIGNKAVVSYNGIGISQPVTLVTGVSVINVDPHTVSGTGSLRFTSGPQTLEWSAPGDAFGAAVAVGAGGHFRILSANGNFIDVLVDATALPGGTVTESLSVGKFFAMAAGVGDTGRVWTNGELVKVTGVATGVTEIWQLESPLSSGYVAGTLAYPPPMLPLHEDGTDVFGGIDVEVDTAFAPTGTPTDALTVVGAALPDGWLSVGAVADMFLTFEAYLNKGALRINQTGATATDIRIERSIDFNHDLCGFLFNLKVWVRNLHTTDGTTQQFQIGFDFGAGLIESPVISITDPDINVRRPTLLEFSQLLPPDATQFKISIRKIVPGVDTASSFTIERIVLVQNNIHALFLGHNTTPRSSGRSQFGSLFYVWCPDPLSANETSLLGIAAPVIAGRIADSHNAHEQIDAYDVTDFELAYVANVRGAVTASDWLAATLINMEVVSRTPARFGYVKPSRISRVTGEELTFLLIPPHKATLAVVSDQDQVEATIYEDGNPLPHDQWQFNTPTEVEILTGFNSLAQYTIDYSALIQVETVPIDILAPSPNNNDTWFSDYVMWNRHLSNEATIHDTVSLVFGSDFTAVLSRRSDTDKLTSVLTEDTGVIKRIIPQTRWSYIDSLTVSIDGSEFNPDAIYSLEYNQLITDPARAVTVVAEIKSAASVFLLASATYRPLDINGCINNDLRFHQIRITLSNVSSLLDARIHSAVLKGLKLRGAGSPPPGL